MGQLPPEVGAPSLHRQFGLLHATALNVSMIVGAGVFITIPLMLGKLPGPYALLGWIVAAALMLTDGLIWGELGACMPGSGGSYVYLLEAYGRRHAGRLMAFLFNWQFLISGPLEIASGLIAIATFANAFHPAYNHFNDYWTWKVVLSEKPELAMTFNPGRLGAVAVGALIVALLWRRMTTLKWLTVTVWLGVLAAIGWILVEGALHFNPAVAFDFSGLAAHWPDNFAEGLGAAMILAMYSYLGYYNVCYIGAEVRDPGRTIPRSILLSALLVAVMFIGVHLALLGVVPWHKVPTGVEEVDAANGLVAVENAEAGAKPPAPPKAEPNLAATFMRRIHGDWAAVAVTALLIWSCIGSAFAGLLGYSRIPYAAARQGHFFAAFGRLHRRQHIPHVALLLVGGLTMFWTFFDLGDVINALITTRILEQFIGQILGVVLLRRLQPGRPRPFRMYLYPLPCAVALAGWLYLYVSAGKLFIAFGLATLCIGEMVFLLWTWRTRQWPFGDGAVADDDARAES